MENSLANWNLESEKKYFIIYVWNSLVLGGREADCPPVSVVDSDEGVPHVDEEPGDAGDRVEPVQALGQEQGDAHALEWTV